jgi:hypothetical protein
MARSATDVRSARAHSAAPSPVCCAAQLLCRTPSYYGSVSVASLPSAPTIKLPLVFPVCGKALGRCGVPRAAGPPMPADARAGAQPLPSVACPAGERRRAGRWLHRVALLACAALALFRVPCAVAVDATLWLVHATPADPIAVCNDGSPGCVSWSALFWEAGAYSTHELAHTAPRAGASTSKQPLMPHRRTCGWCTSREGWCVRGVLCVSRVCCSPERCCVCSGVGTKRAA